MQSRIHRLLHDPQFLIATEDKLCEKLADFITFREHHIYFPTNELTESELLSQEKCLLLPIAWQGEYLGGLRLKGIDCRAARKLCPLLPKVVSICLENLAMSEAARMDASTCLYSEETLVNAIALQIEKFRSPPALRKRYVSPAIVAIAWHNAEAESMRAGMEAVDAAWRLMADALRNNLPENAIAANIVPAGGKRQFAILFEAANRSQCESLARTILANLASLSIRNPLSEGKMEIGLSAGHALFPNDLQGVECKFSPLRQAKELKEKSFLAAATAWKMLGHGAILSFAGVLRKGATIIELLPHAQVRLSIGRTANASPGQRFLVYADQAHSGKPKGQIVLKAVRDLDATADVFYVAHPDYPLQPGDCLVLTDNVPAPLLHSQSEFLKSFEGRAKSLEHFALSLTRFSYSGPDAFMPLADAIGAIWEQFDRQESEKTGDAGLYSADCLIALWSDGSEAKIDEHIRSLHKAASANGLVAATGIFTYPFFNYSRAESEAACLKALEYAELLPPPHIGHLDALALAMSGDKLFSQGETLAAVEEYKLALLLSPENPMILNSLGVTLASLNKTEEASQTFASALEKCSESGLCAQICYNLANLSLKGNNLAAARAFFRQCIKWDPSHFYAWIGLSRTTSRQGNLKAARALCNHAARLAGDSAELFNLAQRYRAKLEQKSLRMDKARELLHDTLLRNPRDTASMLLLASTYLEDDPGIAEMLARKCLTLGIDGYDVLASALEAQGRSEEARMTRQRI